MPSQLTLATPAADSCHMRHTCHTRILLGQGGFWTSIARRCAIVHLSCLKLPYYFCHICTGWNCTTNPAMKVGATICSATQTVVPWSVLPARVTYMNEGSEQFDNGPGAANCHLIVLWRQVAVRCCNASWCRSTMLMRSAQQGMPHFCFPASLLHSASLYYVVCLC